MTIGAKPPTTSHQLPSRRLSTNNADRNPTTFPPPCHPEERSDEGSAVASKTPKCGENPKSLLLPDRQQTGRQVEIRYDCGEMQWLWCWRCKTEMPMLDEVEYLEVYRLYGEGMSATKEFRQKWGIPLEGMEREMRFKPLLDRYEQMTGMTETNPNAVMHHRLSLYGPPCESCGKPLRSPKAKLCGSCMAPRT